MAIRKIDRNNIPLKAYLRADPYSQHFKFTDTSEELVTTDMFWGKTEGTEQNRIYLDYSDISTKSIEVSEGISESSSKQLINNKDSEEWIENNILNKEITKLYVIQGYAGCGKTTFINSIMKRNSWFQYFYVDIGKDWSYSGEPYMFFNEALYTLDSILKTISNMTDKREKIWECFIFLGLNPESKKFNIGMLNILQKFKHMKLNSNWDILISDIFNYIDDNFSERNYNGNSLKNNFGRTDIIVSLIILLISAVSITNEEERNMSFSIVFDNLDVITNPAISAENVMNLWGVIDKYIIFKQIMELETNFKLPNFQIIITVRKVLYSHIVSHLPVLEMSTDYDPSNVNVCDISNLYSSQDVLTHRVSYWETLNNESINEKLLKLKTITSIQDSNLSFDESVDGNDYDLKTTINIDGFLNHNYRAFSNILSALIDNKQYFDIVVHDFNKDSSSKDWQKVSTIVFLISLIYRKEKVWNSLGFGCKDFDTIDYPTTLNRLILNYLYLSKRGKYVSQYTNSNIQNIPGDDYVSLKDLITTLGKSIIFTIKTYDSEDKIKEKYNKPLNNDSQDLIIERLADMCARNPTSIHSKASGYDSDDDELWRRPLYFIGGVKLNHTASSSKELKSYFQKSIKNGTDNQILFSITDEGYIFIRDIVANFEFYSARYCCEENAKPLHHVVDEKEINSLVSPVYQAIQKCCERNIFFEKQYINKYCLENRDKYLFQFFHPRTNPHYKKNHSLIELYNYSFRPQLHIVRVIYNHIFYFDNIKEMIFLSKNPKRNQMCKCLTEWIKLYLNLYKEYFFDLQNNTICNSDNNVYNKLWKLLCEQEKHYVKGGDFQNVNIRLQHNKEIEKKKHEKRNK